MVRYGPSVTIGLSVLNSSFPSMGPFQAFASRVSWFMFEVGGFITYGHGTVHRTIFETPLSRIPFANNAVFATPTFSRILLKQTPVLQGAKAYEA